ncbi:hypothetical protein [Streptomyces sp. NPDC001089]
MGQLPLTGTLRTRALNEARLLREFRVERPVSLVVYGIYTEPEQHLAWMECAQGKWRLPAVAFGWAEEVEDRARAIVGEDEVFPCRIVFIPREEGEFESELRPTGYRPFLSG